MPLTDMKQTEVPDRNRIQMTKPFQTSNAGLSNPKTPNNPMARLGQSGSGSSASSDISGIQDAVASTRRQMARQAVDSMTDDQLSQVLAMASGKTGGLSQTPGVGIEGTSAADLLSKMPVLDNPSIPGATSDIPGAYAGMGTLAASRGGSPFGDEKQAVPGAFMGLQDRTMMAPGDSFQRQTPGGVVGGGVLGSPSRKLNIPWLNSGSPR